jgi:predicted outer membrane repeat protein
LYLSKILIVLIAFTLLTFIPTHNTHATDATVTDCTNFTGAGTISQAVTDANTGGGIITFTCSGTIIFANELIITANVTINSNGNTVIFDGTGNTTRLFVVNAGASLTLNGFTLQNANPNFMLGVLGGAISNEGTLTINNSTFTNNSAGRGGAIYNVGTLTISTSTFTNNSADRGGAIYQYTFGTLTISDSTFTNNSASDIGGAIYGYTNGTITISTSTFTNNSASSEGGAIFSNGLSTLTITNNTFTGNSADFGGAIYNLSTLTITNNTFTGNSALSSGGAIHNPAGILTINTSTFTSNSANSGGAISTFNTTSSQDTHYENNTCAGIDINDNGGNTVTNATFCPGTAPIPLDVSALSCNGVDAVFTINNGDANFDITGTGAGLDILDSPAGLITLTGPDTWTNITITERRGEREFINIGGIDCLTGVIIPPSEPVAPVPAVTVLGCALDSTDGVDIANAPDNTYCRILMKNGAVVDYSGAIPADLIGLGVILAVDVYRLEGGATQNTFPDYARICLAGQGRLFYMDSRNAPRVSVEMPTEQIDGLTCAWIPAPGTVILTN